jgi:F-type H+-transporting ATPase subunit delta
MRGSSAGSLGQLAGELSSAIDAGGDGASIGDDLLAAAGSLRASAALRRAATDPSAPAEAKSALLSGLFSGKLGEPATQLLATAARLRWANGSDLVASIEQLGVVAHVKGADAQGEGDRLEDELFGFGQLIGANRELRDALSDPARSAEEKQSLVAGLLATKAHPGTVQLAKRAVTGVEGTAAAALTAYSRLAAQARNRVVAKVAVATPLTDPQRQRLGALLARDYGQPVHLNMVIDSSMVGGIRVEIGDQVIDGSVSARIDSASRLLAGR